MTRIRPLLFLLALGVLILGCHKNPNAPAQLSGSVSYKGQPLKGGTLTFYGKAGGSYNAGINEQGNFSLTDLPEGEMTVAIETESANPDKKTPSYGGKKFEGKMKAYQPPGAPPKPDAASERESYVKIPAKYADAKTSGLTVTLVAGKNTKTFDLSD